MEKTMKLGTTYLCVKDMQKSLNFYQALLQKEPLYANEDRWVTFDCGNTLSLYNKKYDEKIIRRDAKEQFNQAYIDDFLMEKGESKNNLMILKELEIGKMSEMMYVNVHMPYWYFNIEDPDRNTIEITGKYEI